MIAALLYCVILTRELNESKNNILVLEVQVSDLTRQNEWLITQKAEQKEELTKVSAALDDKVAQEKKRDEEIAKSFIPFEAEQGTSVIATAKGTVSSIAGSDTTGYIVMVDHGNGYFTVYRNSAKPEVKEGDDVTTDTELFKIEQWNGKLGYQIIENESYIDPLSLMEING